MRKILIVDDDQKTRGLLKAYLEKNQYQVLLSADGRGFLAEFERYEREISLVIIDVMLPDIDGFVLCQTVRKRSGVPIIMLTASSDETDRIVGLELGADDYVAKPYNPRELLARIKAIFRRVSSDGGESIRYLQFAGFRLDLLERVVLDPAGAVVSLTGLDFELLKYFVEHPGEVLDRNRLIEATRGRSLGAFDRSLDVQLSRLRQRLNDDGAQSQIIKTVRGAGYVLAVEVSAMKDQT